MKQNLPTLEKRREQWINWSAEKKQIEEETAQSEEALRNTISSLTAQKKSAETLEKDIETLTEQIKRFQKERHEAIASQTPEEVIAAIETEKANATRLAEEAKLSLAAKEEALLSTQNKINSLEAHRSETINPLNRFRTLSIKNSKRPVFRTSPVSFLLRSRLRRKTISCVKTMNCSKDIVS